MTGILGGNAFMAELHSRIVPVVVDEPTFWARYFFHLHQLTQLEQQQAREELPGGGGADAGRADEQPTPAEAEPAVLPKQQASGEEEPAPQVAPALDAADAAPSAPEPPPCGPAPVAEPASPIAQQQSQQAACPGGHASAGSVSSGGGPDDDESNTSSSWTEVEDVSHGVAVAGAVTAAEPGGSPPAAEVEPAAPTVVEPPVADSTCSPEPATPQGGGVKAVLVGDTPSPSPWPKGAAAAEEDDDLDEDWGLS